MLKIAEDHWKQTMQSLQLQHSQAKQQLLQLLEYRECLARKPQSSRRGCAR
ncbi:MAG: hypothetical protein IPO07_28590 [Haliscomenobacter sp.]|nr:hypothetical protein [Haliscomenobacter sp.]MBK9492307.1 hypothetical protein [Haliscomenobacter sp.]